MYDEFESEREIIPLESVAVYRRLRMVFVWMVEVLSQLLVRFEATVLKVLLVRLEFVQMSVQMLHVFPLGLVLLRSLMKVVDYMYRLLEE